MALETCGVPCGRRPLPPRAMPLIGFLFSDTGGGHRSAASAIEAALALRYPELFQCEYLDVFRRCGFPPLHRAPEIYPWWVGRHPPSYDAFVQIADGMGRHRAGRALLAHAVGRTRPLREALGRWSLGVILHPAFTGLTVRARRSSRLGTPLLTVVTDLAWPHSAWFHPGVDRCLVPTPSAYARGLELGLKPEQMRLVGHPVHPKFVLLGKSKAEARAELGWEEGPLTALIVSGAEGMGGIVGLAQALDGLGVHLAIVTGRNAQAAALLRGYPWKTTVHIYGFVSNMEVLMRAADLVIGKPGPGVIAEAAVMGLPMILTGGMANERPNIRFVTEAEAGVYARSPQEVRAVLARWAEDPRAREHPQRNTARIAYPSAPFDIAEEILGGATQRG